MRNEKKLTGEGNTQQNINPKADKLYLDVLLKELEMERNKKQSLENRAGFIITILCALSLFIFDKVSLSTLICDAKTIPLTFIVLIKIISGIGVYVTFFISLVTSIRIISVKTTKGISFTWTKNQVAQNKNKSLFSFIASYQLIVRNLAEKNDNRAQKFPVAYYSVIATIILIIIYRI